MPNRDEIPAATCWICIIAGLVTLVHMLTNGRYGFHRDELQFLSDARHLAWGYVSYPPFTPFVERIGLELFGRSLIWLRLFSVLAQAAVIIVAGLMARELGGGRRAQIAAALAVGISPLALFEGTEFQYTSFELLWCVLAAWFVIRMLRTDEPRWCLGIGAVLGLGFLTKYSIAFFLAGIVAGILLTSARRYLLSRWFWAGVALTVLIALPNFLWQVQHGFISLHFLQHIHTRDVGQGRAKDFLPDQLKICMNLFAAPLWLAGLIGTLRSTRYRMLAWMYLVPLALYFFSKGRGYYMAPAYPALIVFGAVMAERWTATLAKPLSYTLQAVFYTGLAAIGLFYCAVIVPIASGGPLRQFALSHNDDLREEIGWPELVAKVAGIRDSLPAEQQQSFGVLVGNYGEQGAIELYGPDYHLPPPISMTNSAWLRGYPTPPPTTLVVLGFDREQADKAFNNCQVAGHDDSLGVKNEESRWHPDIFVCGPPKLGWAEFWNEDRRFG